MKKILFALLLIAGCDRGEKPEAPTPAESARLDEAEAMLNELASNEEGPANTEAPTGPKHRADEQSGP
jgi:nitrous oxide reductase accessory protein NosL